MENLDTQKLVKRDFVLNEDTLRGKWKEVRGEIQKMWGNLTDDELDKAQGDMTALAGIIQQRYGESKDSVQVKLSNVWGNVKTGIAIGAEQAKNAVAEASENAKKKF